MTTPPTTARADVHVSHHTFLVAEPGADTPWDAPNGLTAGGQGGAIIRTGIHTGVVDVTVRLADSEPPVAADGWDEVEETQFISLTGEVRVSQRIPCLTPQGPGRYGMRVYARGRDIDPTAVPSVPFEFYLVVVWPIDVGPEAERSYGAGVAEELGLPDKPRSKSEDIRAWAKEHGSPSSERGRIASTVSSKYAARQGQPATERGFAVTRDHRLLIVNPFRDAVTPPPLPDGLVAAAPDCVVIRTIKRSGNIGIWLSWEPEAPARENTRWEEFEDIEFVTATGIMHLANFHPKDMGEQHNLTFQGAGRYGLRVSGRKSIARDPNAPKEAYMLVIWPIQLVSGVA